MVFGKSLTSNQGFPELDEPLVPEFGDVLLPAFGELVPVPELLLPELLPLVPSEPEPELLPPMPRDPPVAEPGCTPKVE